MRRTLPSSLQVLLDDARLGDFIPCILDANGQCALSFFFFKRELKWIRRSLAGREEQPQGPRALFLLLVHLRMTNHTHQHHLSLVWEIRFDGNAAIPICVCTVCVLQSSICPFPENVCQAPSYLMEPRFEQNFDTLVVHRRRSKEGRPVTEILFLHKKRLVGRVVVKSCEGFSTTRENEAKGGIYGEEEPRSLGGGTFLTATLFGGSRGHCFRRLFRSRSLRPKLSQALRGVGGGGSSPSGDGGRHLPGGPSCFTNPPKILMKIVSGRNALFLRHTAPSRTSACT